jgi:hypothetical protein
MQPHDDAQRTASAPLDRFCADGGTPIRLGDKNPFPFLSLTTPLDDAFREHTRFNPMSWWVSTNAAYGQKITPEFDMRFYELRDGLVAFGGEEVCCPFIDHRIGALLSRGQLWKGKTREVIGVIGDAHTNVGKLWGENQDKYFIATGYALTTDSLWRHHSWCIEVTDAGVQLIETSPVSQLRPLYFGFVLGLEESLRFAESQAEEEFSITPAAAHRYHGILNS